MKMLENTFETLIVFSHELELYSSLVTWISILMEDHLRYLALVIIIMILKACQQSK